MSFKFVFILLYNVKFVVSALPYDNSMDVYNHCTDGNNVWCGCSGNYVMLGMFKNAGGRDLRFIDGYKCGKPPHGFIGTNDCEDLDISSSFDSATTVRCRNGYFIQSFYKSSGIWLFNIETLKCCKFSMNNNREYYVNAEQSEYWGSDCLGQGDSGLCGISPQTYITGFKRTRNGCCNIVETYDGTDELDTVYFRSIDWVPTQSPTLTPTKLPSKTPTKVPTSKPTVTPTRTPTVNPTSNPSVSPTVSSNIPTKVTTSPTKTSEAPNVAPTVSPNISPTATPTINPTETPIISPTISPTVSPTKIPTNIPTNTPTNNPTNAPTNDAIISTSASLTTTSQLETPAITPPINVYQ